MLVYWEEVRYALVEEEVPTVEIVGNRDPASPMAHTRRRHSVERLHTSRLLPPCHKCAFSEDHSKPTSHKLKFNSNVIGDADFLEHLLRHLSVVHILVWMPLESEFTVARRSYWVDNSLRSFQFLRRCIVSYIQHIVVASRHHGRNREE